VILLDFHCDPCGASFEDLVSRGTLTADCPHCGKVGNRVMSAPRVGVYNDAAKRTEALKKRSMEHTAREAKSNQELLAKKLGGKPKAQAKWNIRKQVQKSP
jgi:putative FmdB family regulatory protein